MRLSQIVLVVLVVMAMFTRYIPVWLGLVTIGVWAAAKLVMRGLIVRMERTDLTSHVLAGARLDVHRVEALPAVDGAERIPYRIELSVHTSEDSSAWQPQDLVVFPSDGAIKACEVEACEVWDGQQYLPCGPNPCTDDARLRLRIAVPAGASGLVISYHGERIGTIALRK